MEKIYNSRGFDQYGIHKNGTEYDNNGFNWYGYDKDGYDKNGFKFDTIKFIHIHKNGTEYDDNGLDFYGCDKNGFDKDGYDKNGLNKDGYDKNGFQKIYRIDKNGREFINYKHKVTREAYDEEGFNHNERDRWGYDKRGFREVKYSKNSFEHKNGTMYDDEGYNYWGYNQNGYDQDGYDSCGFNMQHIHKNGTEYDSDGYDYNGNDNEGYDRRGFKLDIEKGIYINKNGTQYSDFGFDYRGYDKEGFNYKGYDKEGFDKKGYNVEGYDREGFNENGLNKKGQSREQKKETTNQQRKNFLGLKNKVEKLAKGEMTLEDYVKCSKTSIDELIDFAKKEHMDSNVIRSLYKYKKPYSVYKKSFSKKDYLNSTILMIEGKEVRPTEEDVDKCIAYLTAMGSWICDKTVRDTVRSYKRGELNIEESLRNAILDEQIEIKSQETEIANLKSQNKGEI